VLDADTDRTDLELRLIILSLKDRVIELMACVATGADLARRAAAPSKLSDDGPIELKSELRGCCTERRFTRCNEMSDVK
jgi:hypothetical protein